MYCDLIQLYQSFGLWHSLLNEYSVEILHIGKAYKLVDGGVIADVPFEVGICFTPLFRSLAKHSHIQHISFIGADDTCLNICYSGWYEIMFDGIGMYSIVNL